jgi:hypothetical protein
MTAYDGQWLLTTDPEEESSSSHREVISKGGNGRDLMKQLRTRTLVLKFGAVESFALLTCTVDKNQNGDAVEIWTALETSPVNQPLIGQVNVNRTFKSLQRCACEER